MFFSSHTLTLQNLKMVLSMEKHVWEVSDFKWISIYKYGDIQLSFGDAVAMGLIPSGATVKKEKRAYRSRDNLVQDKHVWKMVRGRDG